MFRLIILAVLFYLVSRVFAALFKSTDGDRKMEVRGESQNDPLDLSDADVEDVDYKELPRKQ
jgi:hypothetical protein